MNGFHQNRLESIQGSKQDELGLPTTDKQGYGVRPLLTFGNLLCEHLASCTTKKPRGLRPVPLPPARSREPRMQRAAQEEKATGKSKAEQSPSRRRWGGVSVRCPAPTSAGLGRRAGSTAPRRQRSRPPPVLGGVTLPFQPHSGPGHALPGPGDPLPHSSTAGGPACMPPQPGATLRPRGALLHPPASPPAGSGSPPLPDD